MKIKHTYWVLSAGVLCLAGGCAAGPKPELAIRSVDQGSLVGDENGALDRGRELLGRGQYADAISAFHIALRVEETSAEAHNGLAVAYDHLGRNDLARRYFELALAERPDDARYRQNLARFFEKSGQVEMARGLLESPAVPIAATVTTPQAADTVAALVEQTADRGGAVASATESPSAVFVDATPAADPIGKILADLDDGGLAETHLVAATSKSAVAATHPRPTAIRPRAVAAIYRPAAPMTIEAVLPEHSGSPLPGRDQETVPVVAVLPAERKPVVQSGPYIERVSLGEVNLVTIRAAVPAQDQFDIDELGRKLAVWAGDENRRVALAADSGLTGKLAIQSAVERAAMENALASAVPLVELAEQMDRDFNYAFFDDVATEESNQV